MSVLLFLSRVFAGVALAATGVGQSAPEFSLTATDGKQYGLKRALASHDAAVVVFVATKCPYSNAYNGRYNDLHKALSNLNGKKVAWLAINANNTEPMDEVKSHAQTNQFAFPVLKDEGNKVADAYGAEKTPETFLVGKSGKVLYHGRIDDDSDGKNIKSQDLRKAIEEAVAGKEVSTKETKSFGCSIKRKS